MKQVVEDDSYKHPKKRVPVQCLEHDRKQINVYCSIYKVTR